MCFCGATHLPYWIPIGATLQQRLPHLSASQRLMHTTTKQELLLIVGLGKTAAGQRGVGGRGQPGWDTFDRTATSEKDESKRRAVYVLNNSPLIVLNKLLLKVPHSNSIYTDNLILLLRIFDVLGVNTEHSQTWKPVKLTGSARRFYF